MVEVVWRNRAQIWVFNGIEDMKSRLPFDLLGIDSDNGSEFINAHLLRYCQSKGITFTRSRAYRKNDSCHVEQKNYTAVRQYVGYFRYDIEEELNTMNELYRNLSLYLNYFHPVMKLKSKERTGSRVKKRYDVPRTPYQRLLESPEIPKQYKEKIKQVYAGLNPAGLHREITRLQNKLIKITLNKKEKRKLSTKNRSSVRIQTETCNYQFV
ncbi:MAG: transposase family protein [Candidatus Mariimomonas ferrooxydans]